MKRRRRIYYSAVQRSEIWDRWLAGESMKSIGRRLDRASSSVFSVISPSGGIRPPVRRRAKQALTLSGCGLPLSDAAKCEDGGNVKFEAANRVGCHFHRFLAFVFGPVPVSC